MIFRISLFGFIRDLRRFLSITSTRQAHFDAAPEHTPEYDFGANRLARDLHPGVQTFTVCEIGREGENVFASLKGEKAAYFRPGQGVNVITDDGVYPCFIVSSPDKTAEGVYQIEACGGDCAAVLSSFDINSPITLSSPVGTFYYQALRDGKYLTLVYDGSGAALARNIKENAQDKYSAEVFENPETNTGAVFVIGKAEFTDKYPDFTQDGKKIRKLATDGLIRETERKEYKCTVITGSEKREFSCFSDELVQKTLDKNGIKTLVRCPDGECGYCRCRLVSGEVTAPRGTSGRSADGRFSYIHPCRVFPDGDITLKF